MAETSNTRWPSSSTPAMWSRRIGTGFGTPVAMGNSPFQGSALSDPTWTAAPPWSARTGRPSVGAGDARRAAC
nr:hypothetical protein GCM10020241_48700 [Streptoalloteichus tenebrarius]